MELNKPFFMFTCENPVKYKHDYTLREVEYDLKNRGFSVKKVKNQKNEQSLMITNIKDWGLLFRMAENLGQEAIIYCRSGMYLPSWVELATGLHIGASLDNYSLVEEYVI